jgi:hypothetical protein
VNEAIVRIDAQNVDPMKDGFRDIPVEELQCADPGNDQ